jgi:hypothetical protein
MAVNKSISKPAAEKHQKQIEPKPLPNFTVAAMDASSNSLDLARGLRDLLYLATADMSGLSSSGCWALSAVAEQLIKGLETVEACTETKGGAA